MGVESESWGRCQCREMESGLGSKVHLVKAMVFPVVMYGFESWTIKKAAAAAAAAKSLQLCEAPNN